MKEGSIVITINHSGQTKVLETKFPVGEDELYAFCNQSDFLWGVKDTVARMQGMEVPDL